MLKRFLANASLSAKSKLKRKVLQFRLHTATLYAENEQKNAEQALSNAQFYKLTASSIKYQLEDLQ